MRPRRFLLLRIHPISLQVPKRRFAARSGSDMISTVRALFAAGWALTLAFSTLAAERSFDWSTEAEGKLPEGFQSQLAGSGKSGDWKIVRDELPTEFKPFNTNAVSINRFPVVAQMAPSNEDERFPLLVYGGEVYGDLTFSARIKVVSGALEQIAGLVFRAQDERNGYVVRINTLDGNVRFYKFVNGVRSNPIGKDRPLKKGQWYQLSVNCTGNKIKVLLDGQEAIPELTDNSFTKGHIGFITKSDTVAYFSDAHVSYRPLEMLAAKLVRQVDELQPRLLNFRIYGKTTSRPELHVLAAKNSADVGNAAAATELQVYAENRMYYGKDNGDVVVTAPLHDRNGETIGVAKFFLKSFPGQTAANSIGRVVPTLQEIEKQVGSADDLAEE